MLPALDGRPIRVEIRDTLGRHLAAASIPRRLILLDREVLGQRGEFERILIHEVFHFAWRRLPNAARRSWELVVHAEFPDRGDLGWSAEWRKRKLRLRDAAERNDAWRLYACESFCDTAGWLYSGVRRHEEFTLAAGLRRKRRAWFQATFPASGAIPI